MNLTSQLRALQTQWRELPVNQQAELACQLAGQFERVAEYEKAYEAISEFWPERNEPPKIDHLNALARAEVLLRTGSLTGWLGSSNQIEASQEAAKDLITASIKIFESLGHVNRVAQARGDLSLCYWREGAYDEARINLVDAINLLRTDDPELKAVLLIRAGIVEMDCERLNEAFRLFNEVKPLVESSQNDALKGSFHMEFALLFRRLAISEGRNDFLDQALIENAAASFHHEQAGNLRYLARVENNLGYLFFTIGQFKDAHHHLDRARNLFHELRDTGSAAGVDETRARALLAEGRIHEADRMVRSAVRVLERGGQQAVLAEALTTQGVILARLGAFPRARIVLERAMEIAQTTGDLEGAGRAKLSIIEELGDKTPPRELVPVYRSAIELLKHSQDPSTGKRLISCAERLLELVATAAEHPQSSPSDTWDDFSFKKYVHECEREVLERALRDAGGSVTRAARLLGFKHHQSLISLINARHKELLKSRSAPRKRRRHLFSESRVIKKKPFDLAPKPSPRQISILHVEDNKPVAEVVHDTLTGDGMFVHSLGDGSQALEALRGDTRYDVMIIDNELPGLSGLELVLRARSLAHRRQTAIIMLSGDDCEREAWRAGVDAFLRKPKGVDKVASTITRLLKQRREKRSQDRTINSSVS